MPLSPDRRSDDRRRRLLQVDLLGGAAAREAADEQSPAETERTAQRKGKPSFPRYSKAADMSEQARVTDLVPQRKLTLFFLFVFGVGLAAGLECLYYWMPRIAHLTHDGRVAAFDLDSEGSLGAWFSSATLTLAALVALLIYTLRRHRLDDYRGRYRIWLWSAACFFVMSVDESASLHEGFKEMMTLLTGERLYGDGSAWWVIAYGIVMVPLGLVLLWDMRECWFSTLSLLLCGSSYAAAVATQMEFILPQRGARAVMLEEGCEMLGNLLLLLAMATQARYIIREIKGLNRKKPKKKKRATPSNEPAKAAPPRTATATVAATSAAAPAAAKKVILQPPQARKPQSPPQPAMQNKTAKDQRSVTAPQQQKRKAA